MSNKHRRDVVFSGVVLNSSAHSRLFSTKARRGVVLPLVLLVVSVIGILAFALSSVAWRDEAAVTQALIAQKLSMQADATLVEASMRWTADSLWKRELGVEVNSNSNTSDGINTSVSIERIHPLAVSISATLAKSDPRRIHSVTRLARRIAWLKPPMVDIDAALSVLGEVEASDPTIISGIDLAGVGSPCAADRDTLSIYAVSSSLLSTESGRVWTLKPLNAISPAGDSLRGALKLIEAASNMGPTVFRDSSLAPLSGIEVSPQWHLVSLTGPHIRLDGVSHFRGLLVVNGDLTIEGELSVEGLLLVRGALDARLGKLTVSGATLVLNENMGKSLVPGVLSVPAARLGANSTLQYDRCRLQMALASVATISSQPYGLWIPAQP